MIGLGVADDAESCERFFEQTGDRATYPLYRASWASDSYSVQVVPTLLVLDPEGEELFRADPIKTPDPLAALDAQLKIMANTR